ncbi:type IV pilus assembly protein PilW [Halospina denitrificans]|uniref:Type IV pilus assembly protein PilW n=1 Tax=Halospina denitrificans TaxID=332522 RepID=A0A4R7JJL6_9GAMM|nr:PilW family protein [Halospina denitrificans]TDT37123.1 type IV pilus assembly protein PilW [Halospina denitrificans]
MVKRYEQQGLSIVELMVALLLSSFLTMGMVYIFTGNSETFRLTEANARVQESGRMATQLLGRTIRNADFWGCAKPGGDGAKLRSMLYPQEDNDDSDLDIDALFEGVIGDNDVDGTSFPNVVAGTDTLELGGAANSLIDTNNHTPVNASSIFLGSDPTGVFEAGEILMISSCEAADMFQVTKLDTGGGGKLVANTGQGKWTPGNETSTQSDYPEGAKIIRPAKNAYYIRENSEGERSLVLNPMQMQDDGTVTPGNYAGAEELVRNVRDLQMEFGRDTTGDDKVDTWSEPYADADDTLAIRFSLLVRSSRNDVVEEPQTYCYPGWLDCANDTSADFTNAGDNHLYRVYTMTTSIRNRLGD